MKTSTTRALELETVALEAPISLRRAVSYSGDVAGAFAEVESLVDAIGAVHESENVNDGTVADLVLLTQSKLKLLLAAHEAIAGALGARVAELEADLRGARGDA